MTDAEKYALRVSDPERIVFEFVQGKLRNVVNTKDITEVMYSRAETLGARVTERIYLLVIRATLPSDGT